MTAVQRVQRALLPQGRPARAGREAEFLAVLLGVLLMIAALRTYVDAAPDYKVEIIPPLQGWRKDGFEGWLELLPGYPAAAMLELPVLLLGEFIGLSDADGWRLLSAVAIGALVAAIIAALPLIRAADASRTATLVAVALAISPTAYWALRIGHPEEVLSTGLLLAAVVAAAYERPILAGALLGCAAGKGWAFAAAIPVIGLLLPNYRRVAIAAASTVIVTAVLYLPPFVLDSGGLQVMASTGNEQIFNVGQIFWWFGDPIPLATVESQSVPQPRIGVEWAGLISHPLILGVGTALGLVWCITVFQRFEQLQLFGSLRSDGKTRSRAGAADLASSALLVMAGALYARCYLDTWNVPYYLLPGLVLGAIGEAMRGRVPVLALVATGMMWKYAPPSDPTVRTEPDVYTATFLAWAIPISVAYVVMGLRAAKTALGDAAEPARPAAKPVANAAHSVSPPAG